MIIRKIVSKSLAFGSEPILPRIFEFISAFSRKKEVGTVIILKNIYLVAKIVTLELYLIIHKS